uniref:DNA binding protein n=1 Tax=Rhizophora mucronata TaxID=61149 RepID=A0A2P2JQF9_RHIMU
MSMTPIPIPKLIGLIIDICSCCCMAIGNIMGCIFILPIIWT